MAVLALVEAIRSSGNDTIIYRVERLEPGSGIVATAFWGIIKYKFLLEGVATVNLSMSNLKKRVEVELGEEGRVGQKIKERRVIALNPGFYIELVRQYEGGEIEAVALIQWFRETNVPVAPSVSNF